MPKQRKSLYNKDFYAASNFYPKIFQLRKSSLTLSASEDRRAEFTSETRPSGTGQVGEHTQFWRAQSRQNGLPALGRPSLSALFTNSYRNTASVRTSRHHPETCFFIVLLQSSTEHQTAKVLSIRLFKPFIDAHKSFWRDSPASNKVKNGSTAKSFIDQRRIYRHNYGFYISSAALRLLLKVGLNNFFCGLSRRL